MSKIYIKTFNNKLKISWQKAQQLPFMSYDIDEDNYREKQASIKTNQHLDLTAGTWQVLIVGEHENFAGIILTEDYDAANNTYTYKCKDFHVLYNDKYSKTYKKANGRRILTDLLTFNEIAQLQDKVSKKKKIKRDKITGYPLKHLKKFSRQLNGMYANSKYEMKNYGSKNSFNPLTKQYKNQKLENKTLYELIKAYTIGTGAFIDLYINDYGTMILEPFDISNWRKPKYLITDVYNNMKFKSSTENIITNVTIDGKQNKTTLDITGGKYDLNDIFIQNLSNISSEKKTGSNDNKTNQTSDKSHPYCCKNKEIWISMDLRTNQSSDRNWLNKVGEELKKLGWKVHVMGVGPAIATHPDYFLKAKNGLWVTIMNGVDPAPMRELANADYCGGKLARNGCVPCTFFVGIDRSRFTKGGAAYTHIGTAWDDNGRGVALDYPAGYMAECGVPFGFCGDSAREVAEKINSGGDSPKACKTNFISRKKTGYATNWNWSHDY